MKTPTEQAEFDLAKVMARELQDNCGSLPEASEAINNHSRKLVKAVKEQHGDCWLFKLNRREGGQIWQADTCYNFEADGVLPKFDQQLNDMILELIAFGYPSTAEVLPKHQAIAARVKQLGGHMLVWT